MTIQLRVKAAAAMFALAAATIGVANAPPAAADKGGGKGGKGGQQATEAPGTAAVTEISNPTSPLSRIIISDTLNCQVRHRDQPWNKFAFYHPKLDRGDCGTWLVVGNTLYGPKKCAACNDVTFVRTAWTPVSQTKPDDNTIVTVVDADTTGIRVTQTDSYTPGADTYRTDVQISNTGASVATVRLYRAFDCVVNGHDNSNARVDVIGGENSPACAHAFAHPPAAVEQLIPLTSGSNYNEGDYRAQWTILNNQDPFTNVCTCGTFHDSAAGLQWDTALPATTGTATFSHQTKITETAT